MSHRHSTPFSAVKILLGLGIFGMGGCGGGGGGGTTPEPPEPPAQPRLSVAPGTLNETLELGSGDGTATITLSNSGSSGNAFSVTDNADWITVDPTSGTVAANGTSTLTATYSCAAEENRTGTITVTGSNGTLDRSTITLNVDCQRPEIQIEVVSDPVDATVPYTQNASTTFVWKFTSSWDGQGALDYELTSSNVDVTLSNSTGSADLNADVSHDAEFACSGISRHETTLTLSIDGQTLERTWDVTCRQSVEISILESIGTFTSYVGEMEERSFEWTIESDLETDEPFDYEVWLYNPRTDFSRLYENGVVDIGEVIETIVENDCRPGDHEGVIEYQVRVDGEQEIESVVHRCVYHEPHHLDIRLFQGVESVNIGALTTKTEPENEDDEVEFSYDFTLTQNTDLLSGRETFVWIGYMYHEDHEIHYTHPFSTIQTTSVGLHFAGANGIETEIEDQVRVFYLAKRDGYHGHIEVKRLPSNLLDEDGHFRIVLDPDDEVFEESEDNNEITIDYEDMNIVFFDGETMKIDIVALEIDHGGDLPSDDIFNGEHAVYGRMNDFVPLEEINVSRGEDIDMSEDAWSVADALDRVHEAWLENGSDTEFYAGFYARDPDGAAVCGKATQNGRTSVTDVHPERGCSVNTFSHEIGHNLDLKHTRACDAGAPHDPDYPYEDGHVGDETAWLMSDEPIRNSSYIPRWNFRSDFMGYCSKVISSQYHYGQMRDRLVDIYYPEDEETTSLPLALVTASHPETFEVGKTLLVSGRINVFGQWSTTFMKTVDKAMESVSKAGSGHTISLVDDHSGAVIYSESLRIHEVDHATHRVWSARLPVSKKRVTLSVTGTLGSIVHQLEME